MKFKQARWLLALITAFTLSAAACGSGDEETDSAATTTTEAEVEETTTTEAEVEETTTTEAEEDAPVVRADADLVIWADDTRTPVITPLAEAFGAENGITVAVQEVNFGDIRDRLQTAGPAGEGPDVLIGAHDWLGQLVTSGLLAPVDLPNSDDFSSVAIDAMSYEGQLYGVPYAIENIALMRNVDLVPEAPASLEELETIALGLVESGDAEIALAIQNDPGDPFHDFPLYTAAGGYLFGRNADGSLNADDLGLDSAGGLAAGAQFEAWAESGLLQPSLSYDVMIESFGQGNAPFAITGPWAVADPDRGFKSAGVNYVVEPIPPLAGTTAAPFVGVQGFMVSANAENPLFAQTFITEVMSTLEAQTALFQAGGRPPALTEAFNAAAAADPDIEGFGKAGINGQPMPAIPEMGSVWAAWTDAYALILSGESTGDEAFTNAAEQIRTLIEG
ncbi:MAG: maltose ABC transporter substrate-binding protein [Acidimicrobiales bacterium]|nr:maltose ABC transporter substrate-binding protein [Acidimicrobiales bacterium]